MTVKKQTKGQVKPSEYTPTRREAAAIEKLQKELGEQAPGLKVLKRGNVHSVGTDHPDDTIGQVLLMEALGTADRHFFNGFLEQLLNTSSQGGEASEERVNFMLSVIKGIKPRDETEALLAAQIVAIHNAVMASASRLAKAENSLRGSMRQQFSLKPRERSLDRLRR